MTTILDPAAGVPVSPPRFVSGRRYGMAQTGAAGAALTANRLYLWLWRIEQPVTINSLGFQNSGAVVGNARLGLYSAPAELGGTGTKLREGTGNLSTNSGNAGLTDSITAITLTPGWYCPAFATDAAAVVFAANGTYLGAAEWLTRAFGGSAVADTVTNGGMAVYQTAAVTYSTGAAFMPATLSALTIVSANPGSPLIDFGVA